VKLRIEIDLDKVNTFADLRYVFTQLGVKGSPSLPLSSLAPRELRIGRSWDVKTSDDGAPSGYSVVGTAEVLP
jgi:hypothetical protein